MPIIHLVRHAQASFGTDHYDRLSELGHQQSRWLGEHLSANRRRFSRVMTGTLTRQRETAEGILAVLTDTAASATRHVHAGLDEYPGDALYAAFTGGADMIAHQRRDFRDYWRTLRQAMLAWSRDELRDPPLTWGQFGAGIRDALDQSVAGCARDEEVLVVTSGGAIGRVVSDLLGAPPAMAIELNLQFRNTGYCELLATGDSLRLMSFNNIPHLDRPDRRSAITFA